MGWAGGRYNISMNSPTVITWLVISIVGYVVAGQVTLPLVLWSSRRHISPSPVKLSRQMTRTIRIIWPLFLISIMVEELIPRHIRKTIRTRALWVMQIVLTGDRSLPT